MSRPASRCSSIRLTRPRRRRAGRRCCGGCRRRSRAPSRRPSRRKLGHERPHLLHLVVVGATDEVDELGVRRPQHRPTGDQPAGLERLGEGQRARLGDDRLVEVEEGRGRAGAIQHRRGRRAHGVAPGAQPSTDPRAGRVVHRSSSGAGFAGRGRPGTSAGMTAPLHRDPRRDPARRAAAGSAAAAGVTPSVAQRRRRRPARLGGRLAGAGRGGPGRRAGRAAAAAPRRGQRRGLGCRARPERSGSRWRWARRTSPSCPRSGDWVVETLTDLGDDRPARGLDGRRLGGSGGAGRDDLRVRAGAGRCAVRARGGDRRRPPRARGWTGCSAWRASTGCAGTSSARPPAG